MKAFRALKIDPVTETVTEIELPRASEAQLAAMQKAVGGGYIELACTLTSGDDLYVDEEMLFKSPRHFFLLGGAPHWLAGGGLVCGGADRRGDITNVKIDAATLRRHIVFRHA